MSIYNSDEEWSTIGENAVLGFLDFEEEKTGCSCIPDERDNPPVVISMPFALENGKPQSFHIGNIAVSEITVKNTTNEPINLWGVHVHASSPEDSFTLSLMEPPSSPASANVDAEADEGFIESYALEDRMLQPYETLRVWLSCKAKEIGMHSSVVYFDAEDERIERVVFVLVEDDVSIFMSRRRKDKHVIGDASFGVAVSHPPFKFKANKMAYKNWLPMYDIPGDIKHLIETNQIPPAIEQGLTSDNYASYFKALLMMEEIQLEKDIGGYELHGITMRRMGNKKLSIEVSGLGEGRPSSLVVGNCIFASEHGRNTRRVHQGSVQRVQTNEIYVKFDRKFEQRHRDWNLYDIRFSCKRTNIRRLYHAVEKAEQNLKTEFLFPDESKRRRCIQTNTLATICDENFNEEQMSGIQKILGCKGGSPFVILGPPGTGKTKTLVETILQLCYNRKDARVLVCAPSNFAADYIMELLLSQKGVQFTEDEMLRLNANTRTFGDVKPEHTRFCYFGEELSFRCPPVSALLKYRVIISTFMSSFLLYAEGVAPGLFSHIFLDDANKASEPETMVPLSNLCTNRTVVVLAGDPMQLGPVVSSEKAEEHGLRKSFLERLIGYDVYSSGDNNYVTKLVRNYRCHPKILCLPSMLFYDGELIACKDETSTSKVNQDLLPNKEFPILFIGIQGYDEFRVGNNPSWFNRVEASKVIEVVRRLISNGNARQEDIGIITPYRQQELKINQGLESVNMYDIKVGSVEQFQGQEKEVIIISLVRSTFKHQKLDNIQHVGFLNNPRRFNVAVTRAKSLLVIVGNPHIIRKDYYWSKMLWHCVDNSSYKGCPLPRRPESCKDKGTGELA